MQLQCFSGAPVRRVAISADRRWLAAGRADRVFEMVVRRLDDASAAPIRLPLQSRLPFFRFLPDGRSLAVADGNSLSRRAFDPPAEAGSEHLNLIPEPIYPIGDFAFASDGAEVVVVRGTPAHFAIPAGVQRWRIPRDGKATLVWKYDRKDLEDLPAAGLALLPGGKRFVLVERPFLSERNGYRAKAVLFDALRGRRLFDLPPPELPSTPTYEIDRLVASPAKPQAAAIVRGGVFAWRRIARGMVRPPLQITRSAPARDVLFHPDGRRLLMATSQGVHWYDVATGASLADDLSFPAPPASLAFSPDGGLLAVGMEDGNVAVKTVELT